MLKKKTYKGTVCAHIFNEPITGIALGIYGKNTVCTLEYDEGRREYILMINDAVVQENSIKIEHTLSWE